MISEIDNLLSLCEDAPEKGSFVGIADSSADGSFLVHYFLNSNLKKDNCVCFVGFAQSFNHYSTVALKQGVNLKSEKEDGTLIFVEGMKCLGQAICHQALGSPDTDDPKLLEDPFSCLAKQCSVLPLLNYFRSLIMSMKVKDNQPNKRVFIIDNIGLLLNIGVPVKEMITFFHYLRNALFSCDGPEQLIIFLNAPKTDDDATFLWKYMQHCCSMTLFVSGLPSGYCKDVHGELTINVQDEYQKARPRITKKLQFKVMEKNVSFFAAGLSSAVL